MQGDDVAPLDKFLQADEVFRSFSLGPGRVAEQHFHPQYPGGAGYLGANIAHTHHSERHPLEPQFVLARKGEQHGKHILLHRRGVAAGRVAPAYAVRLAPGRVDMVIANGCTGYDFHVRAF